MVVVWLCIGIFLVIGSVYDWKRKSISVELLVIGVAGSVIGNVYLCIWGGKSWIELIVGLIPGVIALMLSIFTKEQLGYGDGVVLLLIGSSLGFGNALYIVWIGLIGSFVVSVFLLVSRRGNRKTKLPFVPLLLLGYLVVVGRQWL